MHANKITLFKTLLESHGDRITQGRLAVFQLLIDSEPLTMQEIIARISTVVDRVTAYRIIDFFEKRGIVHRVYVGWKYRIEVSEDFIQHHHHLTCLRCGEITEVNDEDEIERLINQVAGSYGFEPKRHQFEIEGYCSSCMTKKV